MCAVAPWGSAEEYLGIGRGIYCASVNASWWCQSNNELSETSASSSERLNSSRATIFGLASKPDFVMLINPADPATDDYRTNITTFDPPQ
jgi:hypothetical protein